MGIAALIVSIIALLISLIPIFGIFACIPALVSFILSIVDIVKKSKTGGKKGVSIAGLIISILVPIVAVVWSLGLGIGLAIYNESQDILDDSFNEINSIASNVESNNNSFDYYSNNFREDLYNSNTNSLYNNSMTNSETSNTIGNTLTNDVTNSVDNTISNSLTNSEANNAVTGNQATNTSSFYGIDQPVIIDGVKTTLLSSNLDFTDYFSYTTVESGYKIIKADFDFENTSDTSKTVSSYRFNCYADNYSCSSFFSTKDATFTDNISAGMKTKGSVYFKVPANAKEVVLEYTSYGNRDSVKFKVK